VHGDASDVAGRQVDLAGATAAHRDASGRTASEIAAAQRTARAPDRRMHKPSPRFLTSFPRNL
jgi:hypothetical protein